MNIDVGPHSNLTLKLLQHAKAHCPIIGMAKGLSFWKAKKKEILPKREVNIITCFALLNDFESPTKKEIKNSIIP